MYKLNLSKYEAGALYSILNSHLNIIGVNSLNLYKGKAFSKNSDLRNYLLSLEDLESRLAKLLNKTEVCDKENIVI
jgi:hypothetical protein